MSTSAPVDPGAAAPVDPRAASPMPGFAERLRGDPAYQTFVLLRVAFTVAPILFGLDKFFDVMFDWDQYVAPGVNGVVPGGASTAVHLAGAIEIGAGLFVALKPRYGAYVMAAWPGGIIFDLLTYSGYYNIALRDFGLMLGALTLVRLASVYESPGSGREGHTWLASGGLGSLAR